MQEELNLVRQFHDKFEQPVLDAPSLIPVERSSNRYSLMHEEVEEYREGVRQQDLPNIAKELADILFTTYGTILEHGLQNIMPDVFREVVASNMSKEYHEFKMIKGEQYVKANIEQFFKN